MVSADAKCKVNIGEPGENLLLFHEVSWLS